jgi:hypothetical protein
MAEVCRAFRNTGRCRNGDECKFEHSEGETITPPPAGECFNFKQDGACQFGDRCRFTHGVADPRFDESGLRKKMTRAPREPRAAAAPAAATEGGGEKKPRKKKPRARKPRENGPPREKLEEVCNNYLAGKCRYGENCRRQHPGNVPQDNIETA